MATPAEIDDPSRERHTADIRRLVRPLRRSADLAPLLERIADRSYVLLGEASHGTSEYYRWRAEITRHLVTDHEARFIAVEGDWPDCYRVNRWVKLLDDGPDRAEAVLAGFDRWPTWMWANAEVAEFLDWLRDHNRRRPVDDRVGFYGLDVYSLWDSMRAVLDYLAEHEPDSVEVAHEAFRCFEPYGEDPQRYAWATRRLEATCEDAVVALLGDLRRLPARSDRAEVDAEDRFDARQNAEVAVNAERYYRAMIGGGASSWNVRDSHMVDTLDRLMAHHRHRGQAVVWEHNSHIGDARATPMTYGGMVNVGQLVRERHGSDQVVLVGFGSHEGSVIAAGAWGEELRRAPVPPSRPGSQEALLHDALDGGDGLFVFEPAGGGDDRAVEWLTASRAHRAIGVVYDVERPGNWVPTVLGRRYDAFLYLDRTSALHPLHAEEPAEGDELETFPFST